MNTLINATRTISISRAAAAHAGLAFLAFFALQLSASAASACSPAPPQVSVVSSDAPPCLEVQENGWDDLTVINHCDAAVTLGNVSYAVQEEWTAVDNARFVLEPSEEARVTPEYDQNLEWFMSTHDWGTIELHHEFPKSSCPDYPYGCDASAVGGEVPFAGWALVALFGLATRRRRRQ